MNGVRERVEEMVVIIEGGHKLFDGKREHNQMQIIELLASSFAEKRLKPAQCLVVLYGLGWSSQSGQVGFLMISQSDKLTNAQIPSKTSKTSQ